MFREEEIPTDLKIAVLIRDGIVFNRIVVDPKKDLVPAPEGCLLKVLDDGESVGIGWIYNDGSFSQPETNE